MNFLEEMKKPDFGIAKLVPSTIGRKCANCNRKIKMEEYWRISKIKTGVKKNLPSIDYYIEAKESLCMNCAKTIDDAVNHRNRKIKEGKIKRWEIKE